MPRQDSELSTVRRLWNSFVSKKNKTFYDLEWGRKHFKVHWSECARTKDNTETGRAWYRSKKGEKNDKGRKKQGRKKQKWTTPPRTTKTKNCSQERNGMITTWLQAQNQTKRTNNKYTLTQSRSTQKQNGANAPTSPSRPWQVFGDDFLLTRQGCMQTPKYSLFEISRPSLS